MRKLMTVFFSAALALAMLPAAAFAAPNAQPDADASLVAQAGENIASGTWGTCPWEISADGTLTVHPGTGVDTGGTSPWKDHAEEITKAAFKAENGKKVTAPADCSFLFWGMHELASIDFSGLDTSNVTNMNCLLQNCTGLESVNLTGFDTSNVTNMGSMFFNCPELKSLDVSMFDTSKATSMTSMFMHCGDSSSSFNLDLSGFDTSNVTRMAGMFRSCGDVTLDLSSFDTSKVTTMNGMFMNLGATSLDLSGFDTSNVTDMAVMFSGCNALASLDISGFDTSKVQSNDAAFDHCTALASVKVGDKTLANLELPSTEVKGHSDWYSKAAGKWFTSAQVSAKRKAVADTYVKFDNAAPAPKIVEGAGIVWKSDDGKAALIRSDAAFYLLVRVEVDGTTLDPANYAAREGSTVVELKPEYLSTLPAGEHTVGIVSANGTATAKLTVEKGADPGITDPGATDPEPGIADPDPASTQAMYRLYNPNSGEHFYTASTIERDSVIAAGWNDEGVGWTAPTEGIQVYRLYNSFAGEHHYTTSAEERDMLVSVGWTWEEGGWFSDPNESVPLYRAYNPNAFANNHHYTTDRGEFETLLGLGWQDEGIGWHGVK